MLRRNTRQNNDMKHSKGPTQPKATIRKSLAGDSKLGAPLRSPPSPRSLGRCCACELLEAPGSGLLGLIFAPAFRFKTHLKTQAVRLHTELQAGSASSSIGFWGGDSKSRQEQLLNPDAQLLPRVLRFGQLAWHQYRLTPCPSRFLHVSPRTCPDRPQRW